MGQSKEWEFYQFISTNEQCEIEWFLTDEADDTSVTDGTTSVTVGTSIVEVNNYLISLEGGNDGKSTIQFNYVNINRNIREETDPTFKLRAQFKEAP